MALRSPQLRYISKCFDRLPSAVLCLIFQFYSTWVNYSDRSRKDCWEIIGLISKRFYHFRAKYNLAKYGWTAACPDATDETMRDIARMNGIQCLDLHQAPKITDDGIAALTRLTSLRKLNLSSGTLTARALDLLQPIASQLWDLDITNLRGTPNTKQLTSLHTMRLQCTNKKTIEALGSLSQLRYLEISYSSRLCLLNLGLSTLTSLTALDVGMGVTDVHCPSLARLPSLTWLELEMCHITYRGLECLSSLPLQSLYVGGNGLDNRAMQVVGNRFPSLSFLKFCCIDGTTYDISPLWQLSALHSLWLHNCDTLQLSGNTFERFPALQELQLTECELPVPAVANLATGKYRRLFIEYSTLSDAGLAALAKTTTLRTLSLHSCAYLTDKIGGELEGWAHLIELGIQDCPQVTERAKRTRFRMFVKPTTDVVADLARSLGCDCPRCARLV